MGVMLGLSVAPLAGASGALATETLPPVADYLKDPATDWVRLSPSGELYAMITRQGGKNQLVVQNADARPAMVENLGQANVGGLSWAGDDHLVLYARTVGDLGPGFVAARAWLTTAVVINLKTRSTLRIFEHQDPKVGGIVEGTFGFSHSAGHWYGFFGGFNPQRQLKVLGAGSRRDLYRVDLDSGDTRLVSEGSDQKDNWLISPSGDIVAHYTYQWASGRWQVFAGPNSGKVLASGTSKLGIGGGLWLGRSPNEVVFARPAEENGRTILETLSLSGSPPVEVSDAEPSESPIVDRETGLWIGSVKGGETPQDHFFSADLEQKVQKVYAAFPNKMVALKSWSADFSKIIAYVSGSGEAGAYYLVDLAKSRADAIGYAFPSIGPQAVGAVRMIDYKASDGMSLHAVLTLPPGRQASGLPVVVIPHDGLVARGYPAFHPLAQAFASLGYAVLEPSPRGSAGYDSAYAMAGRGELGRKIQTDLSDGVTELARRGLVDPKRACILGWSLGGYAALAGVTLQHGVYRCAAALRGVSDLELAMVNTQKGTGEPTYATRAIQDLISVKPPSASEVKAISPVKFAERADAPILLVYNKDDPSDPREQTKRMREALGRAGKTVEVFVTTGLRNDAETEASRLAMVERAIAFVEKYNPPDGGALTVRARN